jgi:hypothetical protein
MRKLIDIPEEILEDLQIKAIKAKKNLKKYIEDLLVKDVRGQMVVFYINYPKGVGVVEQKRMSITHPDLENEMYIYDHILPKTDDCQPYWKYEA